LARWMVVASTATIRLRSSDQLRKDMYFRFNQSLQEFVNASAGFRTIFRN
jgi:hypothetical protein